MTFEQLKEQLSGLREDQQDQVAAYLVHLRNLREPGYREEMARRIDDQDPAHWVDLSELRERWKD